MADCWQQETLLFRKKSSKRLDGLGLLIHTYLPFIIQLKIVESLLRNSRHKYIFWAWITFKYIRNTFSLVHISSTYLMEKALAHGICKYYTMYEVLQMYTQVLFDKHSSSPNSSTIVMICIVQPTYFICPPKNTIFWGTQPKQPASHSPNRNFPWHSKMNGCVGIMQT